MAADRKDEDEGEVLSSVMLSHVSTHAGSAAARNAQFRCKQQASGLQSGQKFRSLCKLDPMLRSAPRAVRALAGMASSGTSKLLARAVAGKHKLVALRKQFSQTLQTVSQKQESKEEERSNGSGQEVSRVHLVHRKTASCLPQSRLGLLVGVRLSTWLMLARQAELIDISCLVLCARSPRRPACLARSLPPAASRRSPGPSSARRRTRRRTSLPRLPPRAARASRSSLVSVLQLVPPPSILTLVVAVAGNAHKALATEICDLLDVPLGKAEVARFANGETNVTSTLRFCQLFDAVLTVCCACRALQLARASATA